MSLVSLAVNEGNPVTTEMVTTDMAKLGLSLKPDELADYTAMNAAAHEAFCRVLAMDDYVPVVDEERFPRSDVAFPTKEENPANAWAWKATVKDTTTKSANGSLVGKTVCLKDNISLKGVPCLIGTDMFDDWVPNTDATVVTRVLEAGATILGKGVCENMCLWGSSYSAATGPIDNFYAPGYSAGGSSSGTAVLVARGDVDFGIGGDQGGSIRMPASANGIVGLKPTHGLVPYTAIAPLESIIDHTGPMTKTVLENALLLRVLAGSDGIDDRQQSGCPSPSNVPDYSTLAQTGVKGLKVGIISETLDVVTSDPRVSELVVRAAKEFEGLGATVEDVNAPMHLVAPELWMVIERINGTNGFMGKTGGRRGMYLNDLTDKLAPFTQEKLDKAWPSVTNTIVNGVYAMEHLPPSLYGKAVNLVRKLKDEYDALLETYDVLICPTLPWVPKKFPENPTSPLAHMGPTAGMTFNTNPFNLSGHPALSLPVGFLSPPDDTSVKIPIGMQIIGKWYDEATVYKFAYAWESSHDWKSFA